MMLRRTFLQALGAGLVAARFSFSLPGAPGRGERLRPPMMWWTSDPEFTWDDVRRGDSLTITGGQHVAPASLPDLAEVIIADGHLDFRNYEANVRRLDIDGGHLTLAANQMGLDPPGYVTIGNPIIRPLIDCYTDSMHLLERLP